VFDDLLDANARYVERFDLAGLSPQAQAGLAVVTCIDTRIEPLAMLGLVPGDAKILRNAGARVTADVLRSLILATNLLGVRRVAIIQHTKCAMVTPADELRARVAEAAGVAEAVVAAVDLGAVEHPEADLAADVQLVRDCALISPEVVVVGWRYDVDTGQVEQVVV
jgi:carbonic anhydrase